jgi:dihydroorotate dehydrogenase (fumarate)
MIDFSTTYLGLPLKNPIVASASPLSRKAEHVKRLEEAGVAAVVMYSLFEEQIIHESLELDHYLSQGADSSSEASSYLPDVGPYSLLPERYLDNLRDLKKNASIPIIASLNGVSNGGWVRYARLMEDAGADALELNLYYLVTNPRVSAEELENAQVELVTEVRSSIKIPLAVKLSPFYTSLPQFARRIVGAGADGLVLFNRFYQPDLDIEQLTIAYTLNLSTAADLLVPLRWISILQGSVDADFALTSGVHSEEQVLKAMMVGAKVAMMASELLERGPARVTEILRNMETWRADHEYTSVRQMQGSMSQQSIAEPAAFERANYMKVLGSFRYLP